MINKKVAILRDHPLWAQSLHAVGLQKYAPDWCEVEVLELGELRRWYEYDAVYCINFASAMKFNGAYSATCLASHAWMHKSYNSDDWRTRGVNPNRNSAIGQIVGRRSDAIVCRNRRLEHWASTFHRNAKYFPAGVDMEIFNANGRRDRSGKLRVGWSGQLSGGESAQFKGYNEVWIPLKERLEGKCEFVEVTTNAESALSWEEMAEFYRSLDVFVCTATAEGTPNGPFCAAACGAVIVSTDVGQVSDWAGAIESGCVVPDYGNRKESESVINSISEILGHLDSVYLEDARIVQQNAFREQYSYEYLAPKILEFVCGVGK